MKDQKNTYQMEPLAELAEKYVNGKLLNSEIGPLVTMAASEGFVVLPGKKILKAKGTDSFTTDMLMLSVEPEAFNLMPPNDTFTDSGNEKVFPSWLKFADGQIPGQWYFEIDQQEFCVAFKRKYNLEKVNGSFFIDGSAISEDDLREMVLRRLYIARKDAGQKVNPFFYALKASCKDKAPAPGNRQRLTIDAFNTELTARGYGVKYNLISQMYEFSGKTATDRELKADDLTVLMHDALADDYKGASLDMIQQYTAFIARENAYNPILDFLNTITWDGSSRIDGIYNLLGVNDQLSKAMITKFLFQCVALLYNDEKEPFGADGVLTLVGKQGIGKTSFLRNLAIRPEWFGESESIDDRDKDTKRRCITVWISELGEVGNTMRKSDLDGLKGFITMAVDMYRLPYGRTDIITPRHTALCATCNPDKFLIDTTGNRRWWTIPTNKKITQQELSEFDFVQLWAEIHAIVNGMSYAEKASCFRLNDAEREALDIRNRGFEKPLKGEEEIRDILSEATLNGYAFQEMTLSQFKENWPVLRAYNARQIGEALQHIGLQIRRTKEARLYTLPVPTCADIKRIFPTG